MPSQIRRLLTIVLVLVGSALAVLAFIFLVDYYKLGIEAGSVKKPPAVLEKPTGLPGVG